MKEPIRILQILSNLSFGGVQTVVMNYYRHIDREKIQFDFIIQSEKEGYYEQEILNLGGKIYRISPMHLQKEKFKKELFDILVKHPEYKIIHTHQNFLNIIPLFIAKKANVPIRISHSHSNYSSKKIIKKIQRFLFKIILPLYATDYFACSLDSAKWLYGKRIIKNKKLKIVYNAIDTDSFLFDPKIRRKIRKELNIDKKFALIHVGTFTDAKNHEYLFEIFRYINRQNKNSVLLLIGDGEKKERLKLLAKEYGLFDDIMFLGKKSNVHEFMMAGDYFIFPSKYEGLPLSLVEAQISGLQCIVSEAVPNDVNLFGDMTFMDIKRPPEEWGQKILGSYISRDIKKIKNPNGTNYDIRKESVKLEYFYERRGLLVK